MARKVGVDLGGNWLRVGVIDVARQGDIERFEKHPSPQGWDNFVDLLSPYNTDEVEGFGVAIAGPIEDHAIVAKGPNLPWLEGRNVRKDLQAALSGKKVVVANDMEAATEGEMARGILKDFSWALFDTISTGWGGNLILDGRRVDSEPGHAIATFNTSRSCGAGHLGCYEALYSGSAMERRIREYFDAGGMPLSSDADPWQHFDRECEGGTSWAVSLLDEWAEGVGRSWSNALNRIRPLQVIAYMGTTAESLIPRPRVQRQLRATFQRLCMFPEHQSASFPIRKAEEEDRAIYGAVIVYENVS